MNKDEFNLLETMDQVDYFNDLLAKEQTLTQITHDLGIGRATIARYFKKISYAYDSISKKYVKTNIPQDLKKDNSPNTGSKKKLDDKLANRLDNEVDHATTFYIPIKTKIKATTKAFNVVMDKVLVDRVDKLAKEKGGYSRNELINRMCEFAIDNMDEK